MFIGSSSEGKELAEYLQAALEDVCDADVWDQHVFEPSGETLGRLLDAANDYDFAALVLTPDDVVQKRGASALAPRDNVILELGLFLGALGRQRVFMIAEKGAPLALPTDLLGVTVVTYKPRAKRQPRAEINPAALRLKEQIRVHGRRRRVMAAGATRDPFRFVTDLLSGLADGAAGTLMTVRDDNARRRWQGNLLGMLAELFLDRAADAYAAWLRPGDDPQTLEVYLSRNLPDGYDHHPFRLDEGLAGKVWLRGVSAAHSTAAPHEWWTFREGCENQTYLCAPVGRPGGTGGVLAVGSDSGFILAPDDTAAVELFAALLRACTAEEADDAERRLLRQRVARLDDALSSYPASRIAVAAEAQVHNRVLLAGQQLLPDDPVISALTAASETGTETGLLRLNLLQILAVL